MESNRIIKDAINGDKEAQYLLSMMFYYGEEVEQNKEKSLEYLIKSAEQEHIMAQCELGRRYCIGDGVIQDYNEGFKWFKLASNKGNDFADLNIGFMYEGGYGVSKDIKEAFKYFIRAAEKGNIDAQLKVSEMYRDGIGVRKNKKESEKWLKKAEKGKQNKIFEEINYKCELGDKLVDDSKYDEAVNKYKEALELIPEPKESYEALTWIYVAIGDAYFSKKKYSNAVEYFYDSLNCINGLSNPFIQLRVGQCLYQLNDIDGAKRYLLQAYMLEGNKIFESKDKIYIKLIEDLV